MPVRAPPAFSLAARLAVRRAIGGCLAVAVVAAPACACAAGWFAPRAQPQGAAAGAALGGIAPAPIAASPPLGREAAATLGWTGSAWPAGPLEGTAVTGLDFGGSSPVRFSPHGARVPWRMQRLPLAATRAAPHAWHLLRCALRAAPLPRAPADG
jgi:hypothetical protein